MIAINKFLYCYDKYSEGKCMISYANDPRLCYDKSTNSMAQSNSILSVNQVNKSACIKATKNIEIGVEISYNYSRDYFNN
jgi:hypothetical protein